jgi:hypothetical protein
MYFINEGNNKIGRGGNKIYDNSSKPNLINIGEVISVTDPNYLGRIKVRIKGPRNRGGDDGLTDAELPWAFPLIPKHLSSQPKVREAVFVLTFNKDKTHVDRLYLGPIISQPQQLDFDPLYVSAIRGFSFASEEPSVSVATIPQITGVFPNPDDVSIQGRYNTDITQKKNEIVIRAGKFNVTKPDTNNPYPFTFNAKTQGYIQIKNDAIIKPKSDTEDAEKGTVTNIVSSKINLITHKDGSPRFNVTNQDNLISDDELARILEEAHQMVFGDILLEYLKLLKDALLYHVHNGHGNMATDLTASGNKQAVADFKKKAEDLEKAMLSKNIRIN